MRRSSGIAMSLPWGLTWPCVFAALVWAIASGPFLHAQILNRQDLDTQIARFETETRDPALATMPGAQAGRIWSELGTLYQDAGMFGKSEEAFEHAMRSLTLPPVDKRALASTIDNLGTLYMEMGNINEAEQAERKALKMREEPGQTADRARSWLHLATVYTRKHDKTRARYYGQLAATAFVSDSTATPEDRVSSLLVLGNAFCQFHQYREAVAKFEDAQKSIRANYAADSFPSGVVDFLLGYADWNNGNVAAASSLMQHGVAVIGAQLGETHPAYMPVMAQYERFLRKTHQKEAARLIAGKEERLRAKMSMDAAYTHALQTTDISALF